MIKVNDVPYLLDMLGKPIRALHDDIDTQAEGLKGQNNIFTTTIPFDKSILTEMQIVWRGKRFIITNITNRRDGELKTDIEAEIAYTRLSETFRDVDLSDATISVLARAALQDTQWSVGSIPSGFGGRHSLTFKKRDSSSLKTLRLLERLSDGTLKLQFDTLNYKVNFVRPEALDVGFLFKYGKNVEGITKEVFAPVATVMIPSGNDDMGIESVTDDGVNFVENYSYYTDVLGYSLEEARKNFEKIGEFSDERYLIPGNLMREAERRLEVLSHPQITYDAAIANMDQPVEVGSTGYVQDDELGIKVKADVVRLIESKDESLNRVELNYLIPGIGDLENVNEGSSGGIKMKYERIKGNFNSSRDMYMPLLEISLTNIAATNVSVDFWFHTEASTMGTILDGYFDINGVHTSHFVKQSLVGYDMHGFPFMIGSVPEGTHTLRFMAKSIDGTFTVKDNEGEIIVSAESMAGGYSPSAPRITWTEEVELPPALYVDDRVKIELFRALESVTLTKSFDTIDIDTSKQLDFSVVPNDIDAEITWSSSNTAILTVSNTGLVTAVGHGSATITVSATGKGTNNSATKSLVIPVTALIPESVTINKSFDTLISGNTGQLTASILPQYSDNNVTWTSSDETIATVNANGLVTAIGQGTATITVETVNGLTATTEIKTAQSLVPNMTSDTAPAPFVVNASSYYSSSYRPFRAFSNSSHWEAANNLSEYWLSADLAEPKVVNTVSIQAASTLNRNVGVFAIEGSDNGTDWSQLHDNYFVVEGTWSTNEIKWFEFGNTTAYRHYRMVIYDNKGGTRYVVGRFGLYNL